MPIPAPVPVPQGYDGTSPNKTLARCDEVGPSRASAGFDETVPDEGFGDGLTEKDWWVTVTDIYGEQFTHHFQPAPEVDSSGRPMEVSIGHIYLTYESYSIF